MTKLPQKRRPDRGRILGKKNAAWKLGGKYMRGLIMTQNAIDTQCAQIRVHLESGKSITQAEAIVAWGCYRLGARIFDLRTAGMDIITETGTGKNRYGKPVKFAVYRLAGAA